MRFANRVLVMMLTVSAASVAAAQNGEVLEVASHPLWCSDVEVAKDADDQTYRKQLDEAVQSIDKAGGPGASTGAPFAAKSGQKKVKRPDATGEEVDVDVVDVTVCVAVGPAAGKPKMENVHAVVRAQEHVFARACALTESSCADDLRAELVKRLADSHLAADAATLFLRSVPMKTATANADEMLRLLTATEVRLVTLAPTIDTSGDLVSAATLTVPIEQQKARELISKRPSGFTAHPPPANQGIVVAISLTPEMVTALQAVTK